MEVKDLEKFLKAMANRRRLLILKHLGQDRQLSVGDIANKIELSFKATSKHLAILTNSGLTDRNQISSKMFYRLVPDIPKQIRSIISGL